MLLTALFPGLDNDVDQELKVLATEVIIPWLEQCDTGHPCACRGLIHRHHRDKSSAFSLSQETALPLLPTRVVDVGTPDTTPRLHISRPGERGKYLTLSYRWVKGNAAAITTTRNLAKRKTMIHLDELPKTIRDAILITRALKV